MVAGRLIRFSAPALLLGATVVFPALHQAFHHGDNDHAGGGIRFHRHEAPAPHGHHHREGPWHSHEAPAAPARPDESDPQHGEGALAHFAYALGEGSAP